MRNKNLPVCAAYNCSKSGCTNVVIDGAGYIFCEDHTGVLNHFRAGVVLELISSLQLDFTLLCSRINFNNAGYSKDLLYNTILHLLKIGAIEIKNGFFVNKGLFDTCEFPGCRLKKKNHDTYCLNHKKMPTLEVIEKFIQFLENDPQSYKSIKLFMGMESKPVRSLLFQLIKFGYIDKRKRGVTNYYTKK